jgi:hypothetical protein
MANATLVTAKRITVEDKFSFESEKIRSAMNFGADILPAKINISPKTTAEYHKNGHPFDEMAAY